MLVIRFGGEHVVTWDDDDTKWVCADPGIANLLNSTVPDDIFGVEAPFKIGGRQGVAYRAAKREWGDAITIVKRTVVKPPKEEPGVDYAAGIN